MSKTFDKLPKSLRPDHLYFFLVGPGMGESILLCLPDSSWVVIDSCKKGSETLPWSAVLARYGVWSLRLLVLTHPHLDHFKGMIELLDECQAENIAFVGAPDNLTIPAVPSLPEFGRHDGKFRLELGRATATFHRFHDLIDSGESAGIHLQEGTKLVSLPDLSLECLSPTKDSLNGFFLETTGSKNTSATQMPCRLY